MLQRAGGSLAGVEDGGGRGPGGVDTSAWHMWLAAGVGAEEPGGRVDATEQGGGGCFSRWSSNTFMLVRLFSSGT